MGSGIVILVACVFVIAAAEPEKQCSVVSSVNNIYRDVDGLKHEMTGVKNQLHEQNKTNIGIEEHLFDTNTTLQNTMDGLGQLESVVDEQQREQNETINTIQADLQETIQGLGQLDTAFKGEISSMNISIKELGAKVDRLINSIENAKPKYKYLGCFVDKQKRAMERHFRHKYMTADLCYRKCSSYANQRYFGTQSTSQCFCGDANVHFQKYGKVADSQCNRVCSGDSLQFCGGQWRNSVYKILK